MSESSALTTTTATGVFNGIDAFDNAQRMAKALASSTLVPPAYQGQQGLANSLIALEMAGRMGLSPLVVMQNLSIIHGRPSWSSSFLIATVNASGRFSPLRFVFDDPAKPSSCYAVATDKASGEELIGETITLEMAKREGWWSRKDRQGNETSKWPTMPGQMLRYRSASFWVRAYCPEVSLGLATQEEAIDVEPVSVTVETPAPAPAPVEVVEPATIRDDQIVAEPEPEPEPDPAPAVEPDPAALAARAVERMAQLATVRDIEAATTWAEKAMAEDLITAEGRQQIQAAADARSKVLLAPLTVAARQAVLSTLASASLEPAFRKWFGIEEATPIATAITARQHREWTDAQR